MRFLTAYAFFVMLICDVKGQSSFAGEYRMTQIINDSLPYIITLKLNCNGTYVRVSSDSSQTAYGKWKVKNNDLILAADSVLINHKTFPASYKIEYENIENKLHLKSVPKKEYVEMIDETKKIFPGIRPTKEGYEKYKKGAKASYYEKTNNYNCNML